VIISLELYSTCSAEERLMIDFALQAASSSLFLFFQALPPSALPDLDNHVSAGRHVPR